MFQNEGSGKSRIKVTSATLTNQLLSLLRVLHTITTSNKLDRDHHPNLFAKEDDNDTDYGAADDDRFSRLLPCPPEVFLSNRLARKLHAFTSNPWSVIYAAGKVPVDAKEDKTAGNKRAKGSTGNNADMSNWCRRLTQQADFFFPFDTRLTLWRATSLGLSR